MGRKGMIILVVVALIFCFGGCAPSDPGADSGLNMKSSAPKFEPSYKGQKSIIKQMLFEAEEAWNKKDMEGVLAPFSKDARIMVMRNREIVSKEEYSKMLPLLFSELESIKYKYLEVTDINESSATVEAIAIFYPEGNIEIALVQDINLVYREGKWLIQRFMYGTRQY